VNRGQVTDIRAGVAGGAKVREPVDDHSGSQGHGVKGVSQ
jgi:hypothetical protein